MTSIVDDEHIISLEVVWFLKLPCRKERRRREKEERKKGRKGERKGRKEKRKKEGRKRNKEGKKEQEKGKKGGGGKEEEKRGTNPYPNISIRIFDSTCLLSEISASTILSPGLHALSWTSFMDI